MTLSSIQSETRYRVVGKVVLRRIGADPLLVPVSGAAARTQAVFPLNRTGAFMWERLVAGKTPTETAADVSRVFAVDQTQAEQDVLEFAEVLVKESILEEMPS